MVAAHVLCDDINTITEPSAPERTEMLDCNEMKPINNVLTYEINLNIQFKN